MRAVQDVYDVAIWFVLNWAVPVVGPPLAIALFKFLAWLPHLGLPKGAAAAAPPKLPPFVETLDVVGWLFLSLATVATAFGERRAAPVPPGPLYAGIVFLLAVVVLYAFTLQAQVAAKSSQNPANPAAAEWPSHWYRGAVVIVTLAGATIAFTIRADNVERSGGPDANTSTQRECHDPGNHGGNAGVEPGARGE